MYMCISTEGQGGEYFHITMDNLLAVQTAQ